MARTKTITVEGHEYTFASLSMDQVEEYWDDPKADLPSMRNRSWQNIIYSLQNAGNPVTLTELKKRVSVDGYKQLYDAAMEVSYLKVDDPGEPKAATEIPTSSSSVAV